MSEQGLQGMRVVEVGGGVSAPCAGKLLADLGATVVKIEPPGGDPERLRGPFPAGRPDPEASGAFLYLNTNKRSLVLALETPAGRDALAALAARADLLLHDLPPARMAAAGLDYDRFSAANPRLVMVSITPFGLTGPYAGFAGEDLPLVHGGGLAWLTPDKAPPPGRPPIRPYGRHALMQAGLHGALAGLGACHGAARSGVGEHVDVSAFEVVANLLCRHFASFTYAGQVESRLGRNLTSPATFFPCRDGTLYLIAVEQDQWERLVALMGDPDWARGPACGSTSLRGVPATMELIERELARWTRGWNVADLFHACQARRIGASPVYTPAQLEHEPHLAARDFFQAVTHPRVGALRLPGAPYRLERPWWALRRAAPLLGEANGEAGAHPAALFGGDGKDGADGADGSHGKDGKDGKDGKEDSQDKKGNGAGNATAAAPSAAVGPGGPPERPLAGVRVLDLSWVWAGPYTTQMLAFLGAEVIKVESSRRPDLARRLSLFAAGMEPGPNRNGYFNQIGQDKRSAAIDLSHPDGLALVKRLAARSDVVVSNFATGVMERLGLGVAVLRALAPELIVAELSAYGQTGPYRAYTGYGPAIVPLAGLAAATGYEEDGEPQNIRIAYADPNAGAYLAVAVLAALEARRRHGGGLTIDISLWETLLCTGCEGWMEHVLGGPAPRPLGNHDPRQCPHNLYRCAGDDQWVAVAVADDAQWQGLCAAIARPELAADPRLADAAGRKAHEPLLDGVLAGWCAERDKWEVTRALQARGVPAFPALRNSELAADPHLEARGFLERLEHPEVGARVHTGVPWRMTRRPNGVRARAPLLGEHTDAVLREVLSLQAAEIDRLRAAGAIE